MEKLKSLGAVEIPDDLSSEEFVNFDDEVASTEPNLSDEAIIEMALDEETLEIDDEEEGNDNDNCLLKPTAQQVRTAIETLLDFSLFMDTDDVKKISMKLSSLIESELSKNFKQASIKDYFTCNV